MTLLSVIQNVASSFAVLLPVLNFGLQITANGQKQPPWTASMHTGLCHIHVFHTRKWTGKKHKRKSLPNVHIDMGSLSINLLIRLSCAPRWTLWMHPDDATSSRSHKTCMMVKIRSWVFFRKWVTAKWITSFGSTINQQTTSMLSVRIWNFEDIPKTAAMSEELILLLHPKYLLASSQTDRLLELSLSHILKGLNVLITS